MIIKYYVLLTLIYFVYQYIFIQKRIYIDILTLDCTHSFKNNSVTASCNIRYQTANNVINGFDIFTDRTPVVIYAASWLHAEIILNYFK